MRATAVGTPLITPLLLAGDTKAKGRRSRSLRVRRASGLRLPRPIHVFEGPRAILLAAAARTGKAHLILLVNITRSLIRVPASLRAVAKDGATSVPDATPVGRGVAPSRRAGTPNAA